MAEDAKVVYQAVGKAAGVNVLFDPDFNSKRIQVDLNNVSLLDALRIVGVMSDTFWRPVTSNTIFVAQNSRTKRQRAGRTGGADLLSDQRLAAERPERRAHRPAQRDAHRPRSFGVQSQNAIVMRGTPDELLLAQQLIDDLDKARGEVVVDIAVLEVSKNWERTLGMSWPSSFGVTLQPNCAATNSLQSPRTASAAAAAPAPPPPAPRSTTWPTSTPLISP